MTIYPDWKFRTPQRIDWPFWCVVLLLTLFGLTILISILSCTRVQQPSPIIAAPMTIDHMLTKRLIIVTRNGQSNWNSQVASKLRTFKDVFASAGIGVVATIEQLERNDWFQINNSSVMASNMPGVIYLVDTVSWDNKPDGGLGMPGGAAWCAANSCQSVLAHESAHVLGLPHADGTIMSATSCMSLTFSAGEIAALRAATSKQLTAARIAPTTQPFVCPPK